jgi:ABC-type nitrate/sulfonate/bicarbonate transport system ATPase subunit
LLSNSFEVEILLITHDIDNAIELSEKIYVLSGGKLHIHNPGTDKAKGRIEIENYFKTVR